MIAAWSSNLKAAWRSIRLNRWRTLLTMSGIIIGIASVVTIVSFGEGTKQQIVGQINHLGKDMITIRPAGDGTLTGNPLALLGSLSGTNNDGALTAQDEQVVQGVPHVRLAVPLGIVPGSVSVGRKTYASGVVIGSTGGIPMVLNQTLRYGDFFNQNNQTEDVAVLGSAIAARLFPGDVPLGQTFTFLGQTFIVRGELQSFDTPPLSLDTNFNNAIFIPYPVAQSLESQNAPIYEILAKPTNQRFTAAAVRAITQRLLRAHGGVHNFSVLTQRQGLATTDSILNVVTNMVAGIAAISLLVGGIGIMNTMLVAVTERTQEIGIRKSLGATNRQILDQFLTEAVVISLLGGVIGVVISLLVNLGLRLFTSLTPLISWPVIGLAAGVSVAVGIVFGIMPAARAARKAPIDALRYQ